MSEQESSMEQSVVEESAVVDANAFDQGGGEAVADGSAPEVPAEVPEKAAEEVENKFAAKFAALSRKEKQIRERERQIQQQMSAMEQRLKEIEAQKSEAEKYKSLPDKIKNSPLDVLKEHGIGFEKLTELLMNDGKQTPESMLSEAEQKFMSKLEQLEAKLAEKETKEQEAKLEEQLQAFVGQLTDFVNTTEDYDLIRANDAVGLVYEVIEAHHNETGQILSNKEACDAVEEHLLEEAKKLVDREKVKKLFGAAAPATKSPGKSTTTL